MCPIRKRRRAGNGLNTLENEHIGNESRVGVQVNMLRHRDNKVMARSAMLHRLHYKGENAGANAHLQRTKESGNRTNAQNQGSMAQG